MSPLSKDAIGHGGSYFTRNSLIKPSWHGELHYGSDTPPSWGQNIMEQEHVNFESSTLVRAAYAQGVATFNVLCTLWNRNLQPDEWPVLSIGRVNMVMHVLARSCQDHGRYDCLQLSCLHPALLPGLRERETALRPFSQSGL